MASLDIERVRAETAGCAERIHFNNAGCSLPPDPVFHAVVDHLDLERRIGGYEAAERAAGRIEHTYKALARLLNCAPDEVACVENATRAWDMAFYAFTFRPGDRITADADLVSGTLVFSTEGATVVAVSDSTGGIANPNGLDISRVIAWKQEHGTVAGFPGSTGMTNEELLEVDCDILIPAALENQITARNAANVKAKIVAEAANGPTTPEADDILHANGVFMIPDILCNAGGVTVSYFEWVQDVQKYFWSENETVGRLREIMTRAFDDVHSISINEKVDMRTAALIKGIRRVADAKLVRGVFP